jgi:hypothetical protein
MHIQKNFIALSSKTSFEERAIANAFKFSISFQQKEIREETIEETIVCKN